MRLMIEPGHLALLALIRAECEPGKPLYIVGGAVRDILLGFPLHDIDFVMPENPFNLAKRLAKRLDVGFFVLDDERHTARVVFEDQIGHIFPLDFVEFTGTNLTEDLLNRDFTLNAMAISLDDLDQVIDPLDGRVDLEKRMLRACSPHALLNDPVRVLRAIRLAQQFTFTYAPGLERDMQIAAAQLPKTSYERQRDEFFRILAGPDPAEGLSECRRLGVFETLLPPLIDLEAIPASPPHHLPLIEHTLQTVDHYHHLVTDLTSDQTADAGGDKYRQQAQQQLGKFCGALSAYFAEEITPGRSKAALAYFSALLHDIGKPLAVKVGEDELLHFNNHAVVGADLARRMAKRLQLSNAESDWVERMVFNQMHLLALIAAGSPPDRRSIYRFYKKTGETGVAIAVQALADTLATYGSDLDQSLWGTAVSVVESMLSGWFEQRETTVSPSPLLDGHDLQRIFGVTPGKHIGRLLGQLVEEQASGNIKTKDEAQDYVRQHL
jgi:putative nucleotidyltransferase with HDIG domain